MDGDEALARGGEDIATAVESAKVKDMPGRLIMADAEHLSNGITHGHHGPPLFSNQRSDSVQAVQKGATSRLTNGDHPFVKPEPAVETAMVNGARSPPPALNLPPELLANIAASYTPFSILIERIGQECFNDLNEVIGRMADLQVQPAVNGVNGASAVNMSGNPAIISAEKKRLILDFANRHREKFIKLLVISKWSRKIDDVQQLVHLKSWLESRLWEFGDSSQLLGQLKLDLHFFKQPNPDIRTALEALSSGTASSIPDVRYNGGLKDGTIANVQ